jgi:hypothetical protein
LRRFTGDSQHVTRDLRRVTRHLRHFTGDLRRFTGDLRRVTRDLRRGIGWFKAKPAFAAFLAGSYRRLDARTRGAGRGARLMLAGVKISGIFLLCGLSRLRGVPKRCVSDETRANAVVMWPWRGSGWARI